ncbi:MAG: hypothetical protein IKD07_04360, partial [Clostridia bacterium]|nr:hypothetical protein [Clostridia bacterium]
LGDEAENILFSGNERLNTGQALSKLDSARVFLLHKNRKGGKIFDLEEKRNLIETRLKNAQTCETDIISLEGSHRVLSEKNEIIKDKIDVIQQELSKFERYSVKKAYLNRKEEKENLAKAEERLAALKNPPEHAGAAVSEPSYTELLEKRQNEILLAVSRVEDAKTNLDGAEAKIEKMGNKLSIFASLGAEEPEKRDGLVENMERNQKKMSRCNFIGVIFAIVAVFALILALIFRHSATPDFFNYLAVTFCLLAATASAYTFLLKKRDYAAEIEMICSQFGCDGYEEFKELVKASSEDEAYMLVLRGVRDEKKEKLDEVSEELNALRARTAASLKKAGFRTYDSADESLRAAIEKCRRIQSDIQALEYEIFERKSKIETIENELAEYPKEYLRDAYRAEYDEAEMGAFDLMGKKQELNVLNETLAVGVDRLHRIEVELSALRAVSTDPTAIAEEIAVMDGEIDALMKKWSAYMLAIETLNTASGKLREGISPKLAKNAGKLFSAMTDGKYEAIGVDTD